MGLDFLIVMKVATTNNTGFKDTGIRSISLSEDINERYAVLTKYLGLAFAISFSFFAIIGIYRVLYKNMPYTLDEVGDQLMVIVGLLVFILARSGKVYLAKWLLLILTPLLLFVMPAMDLTPKIIDGRPTYNFVFWLPYALIVFSILPFMLCRWKEETILMGFSIVFYFVMLLFIEKLIFIGIENDDYVKDVYYGQLFMVKAEQISVYFLLNALVIYSRFLQGNLERKLKKNNRYISEQKQELLAQNDELVFVQSKLSELNQKILSDQEELKQQNKDLLFYQSKVKLANEELEIRVKRRTKDLEDRNARLKEYAFINAHLLRAPLCRIKGLTNLIGKNEDLLDRQLIERLTISNEELEDIIKKITNILDEGKELNRELLYKLYSRDEIKKSKEKSADKENTDSDEA